MKSANGPALFRLTDITKAAFLIAPLFLFGCNHAVKKAAPAKASNTQAMTGISACDAYLNGYLACHRAAGTYPSDSLQAHYPAMRDTLLQEAADPRVRPYLAGRCTGMNQQMHDMLQGRPCASIDGIDTPATH